MKTLDQRIREQCFTEDYDKGKCEDLIRELFAELTVEKKKTLAQSGEEYEDVRTWNAAVDAYEEKKKALLL